jgi:plastocyanin
MSRLVLLLAVLAFLVAGCGGDDSSSSDTGGQAEQTATAAPSGGEGGGGGEAASGDTVEIKMQNIAFDPADATAKVGQKVVWTNEDSAPHNVIGGPLKSETFGKGGTYEFTPKKAETISYVCTIHPGMKATLTVTE